MWIISGEVSATVIKGQSPQSGDRENGVYAVVSIKVREKESGVLCIAGKPTPRAYKGSPALQQQHTGWRCSCQDVMANLKTTMKNRFAYLVGRPANKTMPPICTIRFLRHSSINSINIAMGTIYSTALYGMRIALCSSLKCKIKRRQRCSDSRADIHQENFIIITTHLNGVRFTRVPIQIPFKMIQNSTCLLGGKSEGEDAC